MYIFSYFYIRHDGGARWENMMKRKELKMEKWEKKRNLKFKNEKNSQI